MEICEKYFNLLCKDKDAAIVYYLNHCNTITTNMRDYLSSRDIIYYFYLVTFTLRPEIESSQYDEIESYIKKQFTERPSLKIKEAHIVRELTKKGVAHWHVSVKTSVPLKKDRFHYYVKKYGQIDISKNKAQNLEDGKNYISKSNIPTALVIEEDLTPSITQEGTKDNSYRLFLDFDD